MMTFLFFVIVCTFVQADHAVNELKISAFNIQKLGKTKMNNQDAVDVILQVGYKV